MTKIVNRMNERRIRLLVFPSNENMDPFKISRNVTRKLIGHTKRAAQNKFLN